MDIAKIRKKFKEARAEEPQPEETLARTFEPSPQELQDVSIDSTEELSTDIEEAEEIIEILVFSLCNEEYAFKVSELQEIIRPQQITYIPRTPEYLMGVTSLRGKILPVIDLKSMLSLTGEVESGRQKIIVVKGVKGPIGVKVDRIEGVMRLPVTGLTESPSHLNESQLRYIDHVAISGNRFISILNTEEISNIM
jgi:purine-binding chemotaxis protein CheW